MASTESPADKFVKINLNPRIALIAIGYGLEKVCTTGERWISASIELGRCFVEANSFDLGFGIRAGQEKIIR